MKRLSLIIAILFIINIFTLNLSAQILTENKSVAGVNVNMVKVKLQDGVKLRTAKANDKLIGSKAFGAMINDYGAKAAINANYFDAYKTLEPMATIIKGGNVIHMVGNSASLMVYDNNKVHMDTVTLKYFGFLDGKKENKYIVETNKMEFNTFNIWYVNTPMNDTSGVYMYTKYRNADIVLNEGTVIEVVNNKVSRTYKPQGKVIIPDNGYIIYYGKDAVDSEYINARFRVGRTVGLELIDQNNSKTFKAGDKDIPYSSITDMIAAGPMLVKDGKNVVKDSKASFKEEKIYKNAAPRSAIGVTADNYLIMLTTSATVDKLAEVMLSLGCVNAMNLDGGASSGLYANGRMIKTPGRNLNTIFMVQ